jgi:hypothetical protein
MMATICSLLYKNMPNANLKPRLYDDIFGEITAFFHLNAIKMCQRIRNILTGKTNKLFFQMTDY